eukprot:CCRYP_001450-RA/>CCRYP_001450-RA protein AED:0.47 eAED:0.88 QI:0/0/0.33/1/0/0/3/37/97
MVDFGEKVAARWGGGEIRGEDQFELEIASVVGDEGRREADREGRKDGLDDVGGGLEEGEFIIEEGSGKFVRIADGSDEGDDYDDGFSTGPRLSWNHI